MHVQFRRWKDMQMHRRKERTMRIRCQRTLALLCVLALCLGAAPAFAADGNGAQVIPCTEIPMYMDGNYIGPAIVMDCVVYVPLLAFTEYMLQDDCSAVWEAETSTARITSDKMELSMTMGQQYLTVNGRCIWLTDKACNINGTILVPVQRLACLFSLETELDAENWLIQIEGSDGKPRVPATAEEQYDTDSLYWLSRLISAEAKNQPLDGMVGVGNVVLNRVNDGSGNFGSNVKEVIFQQGQFDVVDSGTIYSQPTQEAVVAAKLCLEGYNTVGDCKWFVNPKIGRVNWFNRNTTYAMTIADHAFYS